MKLDMNLQDWSQVVSAICNRETPYEELPEHEQVADRLVLEKIEELLDLCDPDMRQWITATLKNKLQQSEGQT